LWNKPVNLDFTVYFPDEMENGLKAIGFEWEETLVREPNPELKVATKRA